MASSKIPQSELAILMIKCRDAWQTEAPDVDVRGTSFAELSKWILNTNRSDSIPTPDAVKNILTLVTRPNRYEAYGDADLTARLTTNSIGRTFRIAAAVDLRPKDSDRRVRSFFEFIVSNQIRFTVYAVICPFFTETGSARSRGRNNSFVTEVATRFEQLLFLCSALVLTNIAQRRLAGNEDSNSTRSKKRKLNSDDAKFSRSSSNDDAGQSSGSFTRIPGFRSLRSDVPQRLGYAIQKLVRGWDYFARHLGFKDVEDMSLPYARITTPSLQFEVIGSRDEGFVPFSQACDLQIDVELTSNPDLTFSNAFHRPTTVDQAMRVVIKDFFDDMANLIASSQLYTQTETERWNFLESFIPHEQHLPDRFSSYSKTLISTIQTYMKMIGTDGVPLKHSLGSGSNSSRASAMAAGQDDSSHSADLQSNSAANEVVGKQKSGREHILFEKIVSDPQLENLMEIVREELQKKMNFFDCSFQELESICAAIGRSDIEEQVQLILTDPPYNVRQRKQAANSNHDVLSTEDMKKFVERAEQLLRPGGHAIIFCTVQQFPLWEAYFKECLTDNGKEVFMVTGCPMIFTFHASVNNGFPGRKSCALTNSAEFAIHVKKNGLKFSEEAAMVNYKTFNYVPSTYPAHKNTISNVMGLLPGERVMVPTAEHNPSDGSSTTKIRSVMLRPEQKPISLLQELISRFSQKGDIVVDAFSGTYSTAIACFTLPEHRIFVGCEKDAECHKLAIQNVVSKFAAVLASGNTDISVSGKVLDASTRIVEHLSSVQKTRPPQWAPPVGFPPHQIFPKHVLGHLSIEFNDPSIRIKCGSMPLHKWLPNYRALLEQVDIKDILRAEAAASGLIIADSTIKHCNAGLGLFANQTFNRGDVIATYYGTLVYHDLLTRKATRKMYGHGVMGVDRARFEKYALQILTDGSAFSQIRDMCDGKKAVFVVPAPFCVGALFNDFHYDTSDEEYEAFHDKRLPNPRKANARFIQKYGGHALNARQLLPHDLVTVEATTLINPGDEIFVDYCKKAFAG